MKLISSFVELFLLLHLLVAGHVFQLIEGELLNENKRKLSSRPFNFHKVIKDKNALSFLALDERSSRRAMKGRKKNTDRLLTTAQRGLAVLSPHTVLLTSIEWVV